MKICASSVCWAGDNRASVLKKAKSAGFDALELLIMAPETAPFHGHSLRTTSARILADEFDAVDLTCAGLHIGGLSTAPERLPALLTYAHTAIDACRDIGCDLLVMGGPDRASEAIRPYLEAVESLIPHLEASGIRLALENHYGNWLQYIQDYEFVFDYLKSPNIGMTLDTGHFTAAAVDPEAVALQFANRVFHVHVKDHIGRQSVEMGMGVTNNRGCVLALRGAGYSGYLSQELELHGNSEPDAAAADGLAYMKTLLNQREV